MEVKEMISVCTQGWGKGKNLNSPRELETLFFTQQPSSKFTIFLVLFTHSTLKILLIPIVEQFQSSVWINPGLPWFHLTLLFDGWRKLAPCSQAIRFETKNHCNLVISVLSLPWPVLAFDTCIKSATCRTRVWYQSFNGVHVAYYWVFCG